MKFKLLLLTGFIYCCCTGCFAQGRDYNFINYTQENGLPSNESYFVYRDSKDFLWVATDKGVVRFDGNKMENFDLPDNVIFKIREDSKGRVWFFSHTGKLAYYFNGRIYPYKYNDAIIREIKSLLISDAYVDEFDNIIINSSLTKNYRIHSDGHIEELNYGNNVDGNLRIAIQPTNQNGYFAQLQNVTLNPKLPIIIDVQTKQRAVSYKVEPGISDWGQYGCGTVNERTFFFFMGNRLIKLNMDGTHTSKLFPAKILCMHINKAGNIWLGIEKHGVVLMDSTMDEIYTPGSLKFKSISSVTEDYEGGTWFSTLENGIYFLKNLQVGYLKLESTMNKEVFRMYVLKNNQSVLYAKQEGIYSLTSGNASFLLQVENSNISDLFADNTGKNVYVGGRVMMGRDLMKRVTLKRTRSRNFFLFPANSEILMLQDYKTFFWTNGNLRFLGNVGLILNQWNHRNFSQAVLSFQSGIIFMDQKKQIWSGTIHGLNKIDTTTATQVPFKNENSLFKKGITCMRQMDNGTYTIGIRFGGIAVMQDTNVIANITEKEGLLNNAVKYLLPIGNQLWAATAKGISVISFQSYSPLKYTITNIGKSKGFYNLIVNQLVSFNGSILAATKDGIYFIDRAEEILEEKPAPIPFYISTVSYFGGDTTSVNSLTVPYNKNRINIKYAALSFNAQDEVEYYYRFDNNDTTWQVTKSTELLLENLSPGTYNIEVKAAIPYEKRVSVIRKLQITVEIPWWQNNWLRLSGFILVIAGIYFFSRQRINAVTKREKEKTAINTKMVELEQMALRSQMNPHFIFNCLTSIQQLIVSGNKTEANEYLVKFARLIRKTLELSSNSFITLTEEINYIKEYLALEQLRIPGQFNFSIEMDEAVNPNKTEIPGMMLQPVVENSIRHGIKHLEHKTGQISISLKKGSGFILCTITDNGVGRGRADQRIGSAFTENKSYGMDIVARRLMAISSDQQNNDVLCVEDLVNDDGSPAGTKVIMKLPFKTRQI